MGARYDADITGVVEGRQEAVLACLGEIANLIEETPMALGRRQAWEQRQSTCDVFVVIADEGKRPDALALVNDLRNGGIRTDFPLTATKINKQFKQADAALARFAIVIGNEFPELKAKNLSSRTETSVPPNADRVEAIRRLLDQPGGLVRHVVSHQRKDALLEVDRSDDRGRSAL